MLRLALRILSAVQLFLACWFFISNGVSFWWTIAFTFTGAILFYSLGLLVGARDPLSWLHVGGNYLRIFGMFYPRDFFSSVHESLEVGSLVVVQLNQDSRGRQFVTCHHIKPDQWSPKRAEQMLSAITRKQRQVAEITTPEESNHGKDLH